MALLLVDNQDSFTYNLVHAFEVLGARVEVVSSQGIGIEDCLSRFPERVVISPGPGTPSNAGISKALIQACAGKAPVLGVCLGHHPRSKAYPRFLEQGLS
jgi:anthranilate/para-aminobenzoate synthase component II